MRWYAHAPLLRRRAAGALMFTNQLREAEARLQAAERCLEAGVSAEQNAFSGAR